MRSPTIGHTVDTIMATAAAAWLTAPSTTNTKTSKIELNSLGLLRIVVHVIHFEFSRDGTAEGMAQNQ